MWQKLFDVPWPDADNLLPLAAQQQAASKIRRYWQAWAWQIVLGEVILGVAAWYQKLPALGVYVLLAALVALAYGLGYLPTAMLWLMGSSTLLMFQGMLVKGLGPVTSLTLIVPYTFAGMLLSGRKRVIVQTWCLLIFWASLIYGVLPVLGQAEPPTYILISYDILLAVFTFQTLRFLNHLTVEINSAYVSGQIREQSQQFLARVSHELRTPLNSILGFAKLLRRAQLTGSQQHYLSQIIEEGEQLNKLVSDLLDSAHLSTGKLTLNPEPCDVNVLCESVAEEQRPTLPPTVALMTYLDDHLPIVSADKVRLRQAVGNLVSNAIKYTSQGEITLRTSQRDKSVLIEIHDTGIGIDEAQQALVFIPFVQLDSRRIGVGLGLDIALKITRLHGGDIHLTSVPGQGSTFTIELPVETGNKV